MLSLPRTASGDGSSWPTVACAVFTTCWRPFLLAFGCSCSKLGRHAACQDVLCGASLKADKQILSELGCFAPSENQNFVVLYTHHCRHFLDSLTFSAMVTDTESSLHMGFGHMFLNFLICVINNDHDYV